MSDSKWVETKKECEISERGDLITKRVTLELKKSKYLGLEKKELIDYAIRVVALFAIFTPLWLFYQQQVSEQRKQKALFQLSVYTDVTTQLHTILDKPISSKEFEESKNKLLYELSPKIALINDWGVVYYFGKIEASLRGASNYINVKNEIDSIEPYFIYLQFMGDRKAGMKKKDWLQHQQKYLRLIEGFRSGISNKLQKNIMDRIFSNQRDKSFEKIDRKPNNDLEHLQTVNEMKADINELENQYRSFKLEAELLNSLLNIHLYFEDDLGEIDKYSPRSRLKKINNIIPKIDSIIFKSDSLTSSFQSNLSQYLFNNTIKLDSTIRSSIALLYNK